MENIASGKWMLVIDHHPFGSNLPAARSEPPEA